MPFPVLVSWWKPYCGAPGSLPLVVAPTEPYWLVAEQLPPQPPTLSSTWAPSPVAAGLEFVELTCQRMADPGATPSSAHSIVHSICVPSLGPVVEPRPAPSGIVTALTNVRSPAMEWPSA